MKNTIVKEIIHVDGVTRIKCKGIINADLEFVGEYKFEGMTYGVTIQLAGCEVGQHDIIPMLGYENSIIGEQCRQCGEQFK